MHAHMSEKEARGREVLRSFMKYGCPVRDNMNP